MDKTLDEILAEIEFQQGITNDIMNDNKPEDEDN